MINPRVGGTGNKTVFIMNECEWIGLSVAMCVERRNSMGAL